MVDSIRNTKEAPIMPEPGQTTQRNTSGHAHTGAASAPLETGGDAFIRSQLPANANQAVQLRAGPLTVLTAWLY